MLSTGLEQLKKSLSCCTYNGAQHTHILIEENDSEASLKKVTLAAPNGDWFSFNPDAGRKCKRIHQSSNLVIMSPLLAIGSEHSHHKACDTVVAVNKGGQLSLVYIDLKSNNPDGYANQFKSTRQFVRYILGILEEFHQEKLSIADERYVILYGGEPILLNKTTTVPKQDKIGKTRPNNAYKLRVPNKAILYLKQFLE